MKPADSDSTPSSPSSIAADEHAVPHDASQQPAPDAPEIQEEDTSEAVEMGQSGVTPDVVRGEVRDLLRSHERRRRVVPRAALVSLLAGLLAVAFRWALDEAELARAAAFAWARSVNGVGGAVWGVLLPPLWGAIGAGAAVWMVRRLAPEASGSGIPHVKAVLHRLRVFHAGRVLGVKFVGGVLAIGGGLALGREGPTIQMGAAVGELVARRLRVSARERGTLIAAGAGAGLAAAFNAPLAGMVFVLEELQRDFAPGAFIGAFVAAITADAVSRVLTGQMPAFHVVLNGPPSLAGLPLFALLGVVCGVAGVGFNRVLLGSLNLAGWVSGRLGVLGAWSGAIVGALVGIVGLLAPSMLGGGHALVEEVLSGRTPLGIIPLLFAVRLLLTGASYSTGTPGGIFAPLLVLGALLGLAVGQIGHALLPTLALQPQNFAVVGMAALFAAIVRAPLTAIVLIVEMTGGYDLVLPLALACLCAFGVADGLKDLPIYEALLERDLLRGQDEPRLEGSLLLDVTLEPGAPFDGQDVGALGLPPGCALVALHRGLREHVPLPDTRLQAGDRLTAVIAPQAAPAVVLLREGARRGGAHRPRAAHEAGAAPSE